MAQNEIAVQARKIVPGYKVARKMLMKISADAERIATSLPDLKARVKKTAETEEKKAKAALENAKEVLERFLKAAQAQPDIDSFLAEVAALETALAGAGVAIKSGDFYGSLNSSRTVREDADHFAAEMKRTIRKSKLPGQLPRT